MSESKEKKVTEEIDIKTLNIYEKMSRITSELGVVAKGLDVKINSYASYKAVSERDVLDKIKPLEAKYRIYSYPTDRRIVDSGELVSKTKTGDEKTTLYLRLETTYRFVNMDNSTEFIDIKTYGDGLDTGDKAPGKAMTYADKYALMKAYKMSTGDDPDQEASPENGYEVKSKTTPKVNTEERISPIQVQMLEAAISKYKISKENTHAILRKYGYDNMQQIKVKDYDKIVEDYKSMI